MISKTALKLKNLVNNILHPYLEEHGFKSKGYNSYKSNGDIGYAFNIQKDRWSNKEEINFTFNLGVFSRSYFLAENENASKLSLIFPTHADCVIECRVGELKFGRDHWYKIESDKLESNVIRETSGDIIKYVLPYFDPFKTADSIIEYLKNNLHIPANDYKLFVMLIQKGEKEESKRIYRELLENATPLQLQKLLALGQKYGVD